MPIQYEIPILASLGAPKDEPTAWVHATSFEECVRLAFERGRKRYDLKTIGRLAGIHGPHVSDVAFGKRPLKADKVDIICWLTGCNAPRQWLDMQREAIAFEADAYAKELIFQQFKRAAA